MVVDCGPKAQSNIIIFNKLKMSSEKLEIKIIFENENFLAINKPKNLLIHGDGRSEVFTLAD
jgi:23S rRNA-/tRNA-specific pseudouridylate synthase